MRRQIFSKNMDLNGFKKTFIFQNAVIFALLIFMTFMICACQDKKIEIKSLSDLENKKIGCQLGTTGESFLSENFDSVEIHPFRDGNEACFALSNNEIDAVVWDEFPAAEAVRSNPNLKIVDLNLDVEEYAVAVRKGDKELLDSINATIRKMKDAGTFEMLKKSFMPPDGNILIPELETGDYSDSIKMGTNAAFPPFEYTNGTNVAGFDVSFAKYIANDLHKNLQVFDISFSSLFDALEAGSIDFVCAGLTVNEERKALVDFSESYFTSKQVIVVRK